MYDESKVRTVKVYTYYNKVRQGECELLTTDEVIIIGKIMARALGDSTITITNIEKDIAFSARLTNFRLTENIINTIIELPNW